LRAKPDHPDCHANIAIQLLKRGENMEALRHISEAVSIMPDGTTYSYRNILILTTAVGEYYNIGAAVYALSGDIKVCVPSVHLL